MEVGTKQSRTAVNSGAKAADPMDTSISGSYEDLGGPTPENYRSDDDSAKLKTPGRTLAHVSNVVNKGSRAADAMSSVKEEEEYDEEVIEEEQSEEISEEEYDIEEDVNALLGGEELSEAFKEKARTIFEAALVAKVNEVKEALEEQYQERLSEEVREIAEQLQDRIDSYLEYVADEWFTENQLAVDYGLKTEMTESFLSGMKRLFEDHYVTIPEDKYDVLESMVDKLDDMETKLNEQIEKNIHLNQRLAESVADGILDQVSEGLAVTQKEKLASLAESVEFESESEYREKLEMLRESYFSSQRTPKAQPETLSEGVDVAPEEYSGTMAAYLRTLSAVAKS